ncbi:transposase [Bradyrhizobium sp. USDA 4508]
MPREHRLQHSIFHDEASARGALEHLRWPEGYRCLECRSPNVEKIGGEKRAHRAGLLRCKDCRRQFTVTVGTVFHRSKVPLNKWMQIVHMEAHASRRGHNSWQMALATDLTHKTVEKVRARIYAGVGKYEGPNNIFGRRLGAYVRSQRPQSYQRPPKPGERDDADEYMTFRQACDFRRWYAWRKRNPLGPTIEAQGVLGGDLARTEKLLVHLLGTGQVKLVKKRRTKKAGPSHARWLPKAPKTRPKTVVQPKNRSSSSLQRQPIDEAP